MKDGYLIVQEAFERLRGAAGTPDGLDTLPVGPSHAVGDARIAHGVHGEVHILVSLPHGREKFAVNGGSALRTEWRQVHAMDGNAPGMNILFLTCTDARLHPTLISLIGETVDRAERSGRPCIDELADALASWRAILARDQSKLSRNAMLGLFGELSILIRMAQRDPMAAIEAWRGPENAPHDFRRRNALEVKTLSGAGAPCVRIHGTSQLDPPDGGSLHMIALRLVESEDGQRLHDLIEEASTLGVPHQTLIERAGKIDSVDDARRLTIREMRLFSVTDDFPGIRSSQMTAAQRRGVDDLSYSLQLDACPGEVPAEQLERILEEL